MKIQQTLSRLFVLLSAGFVLYACEWGGAANGRPQHTSAVPAPTQQLSSTETPEPTATLSPTSTVILSPTPSPTLTQTPGPSPTLAPTPVFGTAKVGNDFLFGNQPEGCELPCWQMLVVGKSGLEDIRAMLETSFGFEGTNAVQLKSSFVESNIPGLVRLSHQWILWEDGISADWFYVSVLLQQDTQMLEVISLDGKGDQFEPYTSPQSILRNLGAPSNILFRTQLSEAAQWYGSELLISYDEGVTIYYPPFLSRVTYQTGSDTLELCLGDLLGQYGAQVQVHITQPLMGDDIDTLFSPLRYAGKQTEKISPYFKPLEEVFEISLEEVTDLAQTRDNACIYATLP